MIGKVLFVIAFSTVNTQRCPVTIPCHQGGSSSIGLQPIYAKVRAVPTPTLAGPPPILAAPSVPRAVLPNANIAIPNQQLLCPLEYSILSPYSPSTLTSTLPLPSPSLVSETCYSPFTIPAPYPEFILTDYENDFCVSEPLLDISLGCLDPILTRYGMISEVSLSERPQNPLISPFLPAASPVSALAPPVSPLLPPALPSECSCHFLKKIAIPPPFI